MKGEMGLVLCFAHVEGYALPGMSRIGEGSARGTMHVHDGFPVVIHGADGVVHGTLWLIDEGLREETLVALDMIHGAAPHGLSPHCRTIAIEGGRLPVLTWHWRDSPPSPAIASGRWEDRTEPRLALAPDGEVL